MTAIAAGVALACSRPAPGPAGADASADATAPTSASATPSPTPTATASANSTSTPAANATPTANAGSPPAGSRPGSPVPISAAVAVIAGHDQPLVPDGVTLIDPGAAFRVEVAAHLTDGRLALHDEQDAMVASSGTTEAGDGWTKYQLRPDEPLRPGSSYVLRLDGAAAREAHDAAGKAYAPFVLKLKTSGERTAPARKKHRRQRR
jgi:hypothetical protein